MAKVDDAAWVEKARLRKAYRDHHRDKSFREVGMTKGAHMGDFSLAPQQRAEKIADMLSLTAKSSILDGPQKDMINAMQTALSAAGLGLGGQMATYAKIDAVLSLTEMTALASGPVHRFFAVQADGIRVSGLDSGCALNEMQRVPR